MRKVKYMTTMSFPFVTSFFDLFFVSKSDIIRPEKESFHSNSNTSSSQVGWFFIVHKSRGTLLPEESKLIYTFYMKYLTKRDYHVVLVVIPL